MICRIARKVHKQLTEKFSFYDITLEQWVILKTLSENDGISQKQLSVRLQKDQNTIKAMVDKMESKQFLRRESNPKDKRAFLLFVTVKGSLLVEELSLIDEAAIAEVEKPLSREEVGVLKSMLSCIEKGLDEQKLSARCVHQN